MKSSTRIMAMVSVAACVAAVAATGSLESTFAADRPGDSDTTLRVVATRIDDSFVNPGGGPIDFVHTFPEVGAQHVFHDTLTSPGGAPLGDDGGVCTVTTLTKTSLNTNDRGNSECVITFALPGGEVTVQQVGDHPPASVDQAVTGGTGIYRGVDGDCVVTFPAPNTADLVFHLTRDQHG